MELPDADATKVHLQYDVLISLRFSVGALHFMECARYPSGSSSITGLTSTGDELLAHAVLSWTSQS